MLFALCFCCYQFTPFNRLTALKLVKPDFCNAVEDTLIRAATMGQLKGLVTEETLKQMLEQFSTEGGVGNVARKKVTIQRRKTCDSDEDDDDSDLL